jgi:hypothetical protein
MPLLVANVELCHTGDPAGTQPFFACEFENPTRVFLRRSLPIEFVKFVETHEEIGQAIANALNGAYANTLIGLPGEVTAVINGIAILATVKIDTKVGATS